MHKPTGSRLPPSSSALVALASLTPPSPILSPSQLPTILTSGDIPILFDFIAETSSLSCIAHARNEGTRLDILLGSSIDTLDTVGTFGPTSTPAPSSPEYLRHNIYTQKPSEVETPEAALALPQPSALETCSAIQQKPAGSSYVAFGDTTLYNTWPSEDEPPPLTRHSLVTADAGKTLPDDSISTSQLPINSYAPSDDSSLSSNLVNDPCPWSQQQNAPNLPNGASGDTFVSMNTRQMVVAATLATLESARCGSVPLSPRVKDRHQNIAEAMNNLKIQAPLPPSKPKLPRHLLWLPDTTVELLIDQEGFRCVHARFKFSGYSKQTFGAREDDEVQFRPTTRQVFYFHYAPFDGLPVLRRITTNEQESRDYISRQASLSLKSNGVYTVRGHEAPSTQALYERPPRTHPGSDPVKLSWRFDYLVGDRYDSFNNAGKRFDDGEKILTPLTFSCSPLLLHPLQGRRVKIMHVVRKSVATKLVAEKMEPPTIRPINHSSQLASPVLQTITAQPQTNPRTRSTHIRAKSHAPRQELIKRKPAIGCNQEFPSTENGNKKSRDSPNAASAAISIRRRRASSAGEWSRPGNTSPLPLLQTFLPHTTF